MSEKHTTLTQLEKLAIRTKAELDALDSKITDVEVPEYSITKQETPETGFLATYQLTKDSTPVGAKINIPKDFLVKSATIETASGEDTPYSGAQTGDKYIDFVINAKESEGEAAHVYLPVNELVDTYTPGDGIDISAQNAVSIKIDATNANGLGKSANGLKLDLAVANGPEGTGGSAGAMSAADKTKLDNMTVATDAEVDAMLTKVFDGED